MSNIFCKRYTDYYHFGLPIVNSHAGTSTEKLYDYYTTNTKPNDRNVSEPSETIR